MTDLNGGALFNAEFGIRHSGSTVPERSGVALSFCRRPALKESIKKVSQGLPEEKRKKFEEDLMLVGLNKVNMADVFSGNLTAEKIWNDAASDLNGKTAAQISAQADQIRVERERKEKEQALAEIKELLAKKELSEQAKAELAKFEVIKSRFYMRKEEYSYRSQPIIALSVKNGTSYPISRAYFKGTIASPGRSIPWFSDTFNYEISGGLEPGEVAEWSLAPNMFGDWGNINAPADAVFTVEVYRLDGPDKKELLNSEGLSEAQLKRLELLQSKYSAR
jgi:hypothetical protein